MNSDDPSITHPNNECFGHPCLSKEQSEQLTTFARSMQAVNHKTNLTRITETPAIYLRHFVDALQALSMIDAQGESGRLLDVGSGAGVPGLVLACARPSWNVTSLEATGKKVRFQKFAISQMGLKNVGVQHGRAEVLAQTPEHRETYDVVTVRALAVMPILLELCVPFVKSGGILLAYKGPDVCEELGQGKRAMEILGCSVEATHPYSLKSMAQEIGVETPSEDVAFSLVVVRKKSGTPSSYPRLYGLMRRKPL